MVAGHCCCITSMARVVDSSKIVAVVGYKQLFKVERRGNAAAYSVHSGAQLHTRSLSLSLSLSALISNRFRLKVMVSMCFAFVDSKFRSNLR